MNRTTTLVLAVVLVVAMATLPLAAAGVGSTHAQTADDDADSDDSVTPGEQLSGVVGVQASETDAEVADRTYGIKIANAATQEEAAEVVSDRLGDVDERLTELEDRAVDLEEKRNASEITEGQYQSEMASIAAETAAADRQAAQATETAGELDEDVLDEAGVNATAIDELRERADELSGPEVAAIAQSIAGDSVGLSIVEDREVGPPEDLPHQDPPRDGTDDEDDQPGNQGN